MKSLFRIAVTFVSGVSALYFVFWFVGALLYAVHAPVWLSSVVAIAAATMVGRYVWTHTATLQAGLANSVVLGAFITGGVGFAGGFFGPILLMPDANQGPLLGIFITGPLGFILGAIGGAVYWFAWGRQRRHLSFLRHERPFANSAARIQHRAIGDPVQGWPRSP